MPKKIIIIIIIIFIAASFLAFQGHGWWFNQSKRVLKLEEAATKRVLSAATVINKTGEDIFLKAGEKFVSEWGNLYYLKEDIRVPAQEEVLVNLESGLNNEDESGAENYKLAIPSLSQALKDKVYALGSSEYLTVLQIPSATDFVNVNMSLNTNSWQADWESFDESWSEIEKERQRIQEKVETAQETLEKINELQQRYEESRSLWQKILDFFKNLWQEIGKLLAVQESAQEN